MSNREATNRAGSEAEQTPTAHFGTGGVQMLRDLPQRFEEIIDSQGVLVSAIILLAFFLGLVAIYLRLSYVEAKNSDDAAFILYAQDILAGNLMLHGWTLPADSLYLSVIPIYILGELFTSNTLFLLYLVPAATHAALVTLGVAMVWVQLPKQYRIVGMLVVLLVIGFPSFLGAGPPTHSGGDHTTTIILTILSFYLIARDYNLIVSIVPITLAAVGDPMVLVVGILPVAAVAAGRAMNGELRRAFRLGLFAITTAIVSRFIVWAIPVLGGFHTPRQRITFVTLVKFKYNFYLFWEALTDLFGADFFGRDAVSLDTGFVLLHLVTLLLVAYAVYKAAVMWLRSETSVFLELLVAGVVVDVLAFLFSNMVVDARVLTARYLMPALIFSALIGGLTWYRLHVPQRLMVYGVPVLVGLYLIGFAESVFSPVAPIPLSAVEYLESKGLTSGYGDYWAAAIMTVLSRGKVAVRQVQLSSGRGKLVPYHWESAESWYDMNDARFLIFNPKDSLGVDAATGISTWGQPEDIETRDGFHILVWPEPIHFNSTSTTTDD